MAGLSLSAAVLMSAREADAGSARSGNQLVGNGMIKFRSNDVTGSVEDFDRALEADPSLRYVLWQRGLSLYYAGRYADAAQQFRDDVARNPNDTEEAIWTFLSEAQMVGPEAARETFLQVGRDSRAVMRATYAAFQAGTGVEGIRAAGKGDITGAKGDKFYARLYEGLYYESMGDESMAKDALLKAVATPYARSSGDYMASLATVHCAQRGWI